MTKQQLAEALKRAKEIHNGDGSNIFGQRSARAFGYLEMAVEQYLGQSPETDRRKRLADAGDRRDWDACDEIEGKS
jgi:hypothetical protein